MKHTSKTTIASLVSGLIFILNVFSKVLGLFFQVNPNQRCCFYPSCSVYAKKTLVKKGLLKGGFLIARRIVKCNRLLYNTLSGGK